ncbi:hypothetical protein ACWCRD_42100 [Streptomyces sp. NPDC002092]
MTVDHLPEATRFGDPPADVRVAELLDSGQISHVNDPFRAIRRLSTRHHQLPPWLQEFLHEAVAPPPGRTAEDVHRGESFFALHHSTVSTVRATVGPVDRHPCPARAFTLRSTGRPGGEESPGRRLSQEDGAFMTRHG